MELLALIAAFAGGALVMRWSGIVAAALLPLLPPAAQAWAAPRSTWGTTAAMTVAAAIGFGSYQAGRARAPADCAELHGLATTLAIGVERLADANTALVGFTEAYRNLRQIPSPATGRLRGIRRDSSAARGGP